MNTTDRLLALLALTALAGTALAHEPRELTAADYARAERFLAHNTDPLVDDAVTEVTWEDDRHFVFEVHDANGDRTLRMDAATGTVTPVPAVADPEADEETPGKPADDVEDAPPVVVSPDGKLAAFIRDWNLWVRDTETGVETPLTTDGTTDHGYATDNAGWTHSDRPILVWSPDSTKIATFRQDQRRTGSMTLVSTNVGHPVVETWKYPLVGDEHVTMIERVVIDVPSSTVVRLDMPPDQHRSTLCDDVSCFGGWEDVHWAPDSTSLAFASTSRDHKDTWLRVADPATGQVRTVFHEHAPTYFESGNGAVNWKYLPRSDEFIWFSERSGWGHLYLHDLSSGDLQHAITTGEGNVTEVLRLDPATRTGWFRGVGMEPGRNPYYQHFYKVGLDGGAPVLLTPEDANHDITLSPDGTYFVDTYSTPTTPPVTVLRKSADGSLVAEVARADITRLLAAGWVPPEPFNVKARDGETELYGLMFKPTHFDAARRYPLVVYIYPGPQTGSVRGRSFATARRDHQALAELGFIVIAVDGLGTPWRSKAFHDAFDGDIGDNTLPDQVAAVRQLAARHDWIDLDRIGIWGHSGGGYATADAMFSYPAFFKVGIAESGNHDNRNYEDDWAEKWQGLETFDADGRSNYEDQANQNHAAKLQGKLFLVHGMMDDNVPPYSTLLVVDALVKANKDFDLLLLPHARHGYGEDQWYVMRRRWDYFVEHLLGAVPPEAYSITPPADD
ncbi:MAG TPA: DPP IV N-terminal domain-containing protein [Xanthomonadaceae bacterium]|nr:DPP IV N-terminal domain-containing protein [Xanthomonadaceae bacterium]